MKHRVDHSAATALCLSLVLHAAAASWLARRYAQSAGELFAGAASMARQRLIDAAPPWPPEKDALGALHGRGYASNAIDGMAPMEARQAEVDQALLSLDPPGNGGGGTSAGGRSNSTEVFVASLPAPPIATPALFAAAQGSPAILSLPRDALAPAPRPVATPAAVGSTPPPAPTPAPSAPAPAPSVQSPAASAQAPAPSAHVPTPSAQASAPSAPAPAPSPQAPTPSAHAPASSAQAPTPSAPAPTPPPPSAAAADPGRQSDSQSDPFSTLGSAHFRDGRVEARLGRKVRTVRPRLTLAGQYDLLALADPTVVLRVWIDAAGKVTNVQIEKSSGSNEVDQPCRVALYDWWIEPAKDASGRPVPSTMRWYLEWFK